MISIRQCVDEKQIQTLKEQHNKFIFKEINKRLDFYIHLFTVLNEINGKKIGGKTIESKITSSRLLHHTQYESFIKTIFKRPHNFSKKAYTKLKYDKNFKVVKKDFDTVILLLKRLKSTEHSDFNLLQLDLSQRKESYFRYYSTLKKIYEPIKFLLEKIFDYDWFIALKPSTEWNAYKLTLGLGINVCCYCNKQYTFTLTKGSEKLTRPQLDHFLPQKYNPLLALNFFNLIPSCRVCNSDCKGDVNFSYSAYISPYENISSSQLFKYNYEPDSYLGAIGESQDLNIIIDYSVAKDIDTKKRFENNISVFEESLLVNQHKDLVQEILKRRYISNDKYIDVLINTFPKAKLTLEEAYQIAYGNFFDEKLFHKRPLSKLTKDIAFNTGSLKLKK
ncbi:hypothetical protein CLA01_22340 [Chryseobacterium lathyri]|jgi:hypothetical protein|uniref:HNH nuclease domain-containing protein n=1 Tax=Chryseobacterium lathyri TaxID=395933 RepID=A0A511YAE3_9FLAO|nr:hypothetical protein CLA01_22340 [Chryseobacterium lathyri]